MAAWSARQARTYSPILMQTAKQTQVQKPVLQMASAPAAQEQENGSPTAGHPSKPKIARWAIPAIPATTVSTGVVTGIATAVSKDVPPPPSYAASIQQKQVHVQPPTLPMSPTPGPSPVPSLTSCPTTPVPPPSYNASIQAKHAAIQRALSPQSVPDLPPPPPYPSTAVSKQQDSAPLAPPARNSKPSDDVHMPPAVP